MAAGRYWLVCGGSPRMDVYGVSMLRTVCLIFVEVPGAGDLEMLGKNGKVYGVPIAASKMLQKPETAGFPARGRV